MDTVCSVQIECTMDEMKSYEPFFRAAEFSRFDSVIRIRCSDSGQQIIVRCKAGDGLCFGWRHFYTAWTRRFGRLNQ